MLPPGWAATTIGEASEIVTGRTPPTAQAEFHGGEFPFFKPGDLDVPDGALIEATDRVTEAGMGNAVALPAGSVLVTCIGTLGKSGFTTGVATCNQQINAILPTPAGTTKFLYYWTRTLHPWLVANASATTIAIINKGRFSAAPILLPPVTEQQRIVAKIEALLARSRQARAELARVAKLGGPAAGVGLIDRLEAAILAKAFRGELVPQDPNDEPASVLLERIRAQRAAAPKVKRGRRAGATDA